MKVLVLSPYPVLPPVHGTRVRTMGLAAGLASAGATVDLLCPWAPGQPPRPFERDGVRCHPHFFSSGMVPLLLRGRGVPSQYALSRQPWALGPRRRFARFADHDVFQFELCAFAGWMERVGRAALTVYSAHNVEADYVRAQPGGGPLRRWMIQRVTGLERLGIRRSDLVLTCTERDGARLEELYGAPRSGAVVPHGFDDGLRGARDAPLRAQARQSLGIGDDELAVLFVGGPARHNRDALSFLEDELLPRLGLKAVLLAAGRSSRAGRGSAVVRAADGSGRRLVRLGYVPDLSSLLTAADLALNPVTYGSGASVKMPEYLAAGLPVVSTPFGARGVAARDGALRVVELHDFPGAIAAMADRPEPVPAMGPSWTELGRELYALYARRLAE